MIKQGLVEQLKATQEFFDRSTACLEESDSSFAPKEGMMSVAQHVAHVAQGVDWFIDGMFSRTAFKMDFEEQLKPVMACASLAAARDWFKKSMANAIAVLESKSEADLQQSLPENPIMNAVPRPAVVGALAEHTAHHRGALTVYSRLLGKQPAMPYGEM